jgi:hypothetical protein
LCAISLDSLARAFPAGAPSAAETLLLIDIINAEGHLIVQTVWATTPDRRAGHRLTRVEHVRIGGINGHAALMRRLTELAPAICWQSDPPAAEATAAEAPPAAVNSPPP